MRITRQAALTAVVASLVACDAPAPTAIQNGPSLRPGMQWTGDVGASVLQGQTSTPSGAGLRTVTVFAVQSPSGQVSGSYRIDFSATGLFFEVTVSCLTIDASDNTAFVAGHITATNIPVVRLGTVSYFYATDNGKPHPVNQVPADVMSIAKFNDPLGEDVAFCTQNPRLLPLLPATLTGDIDIR